MSLPEDVIKTQYQTPHNLNARMALHERFGVSPQRWLDWVFDQVLALPEPCSILEVGAGPGTLWTANQARIPVGWEITLTDRSEGMVASARESLAGATHPFAFVVADILALPFEDACFDAVIANHMLYHVEPLSAGLAEICRVLKPGGTLFATTNGARHLHELAELVYDFAPDTYFRVIDHPFTLDNGATQLKPLFVTIELRRYNNDLAVTEVEPIVAYLQSTMSRFNVTTTGEQLDAFRVHVAQAIAASGGALHITRETGMFIARAERVIHPARD